MSGGTERLAAYRQGRPRPEFESIDVLARSGLVIAEEAILHPDQVVYVSLSQVTDAGEVVGELLLTVPELRALAADVIEDLEQSYQPHRRRWMGQGPYLNFGEEPDQPQGAA
jgi:hypothetical protein